MAQSDQVTWSAVDGEAGAGMNYQNIFKVGILIEPSQVRLVTGADDLYTWKVLPQKKHLFSKNISDHSIGAYKELCEGIDSAFEAVPVTTTTLTRSAEYVQETLISTEASFSAKIDELREENENLKRELKEWKDQAMAESKLRQDSEQERSQLRVANQTLQYEL
ncbi:hypothetical protein B0J14DRAFT_660920 [Halenospora varia]|nr:hypothetical protein B0J14DRAFT_660920 [Halenospora varia]